MYYDCRLFNVTKVAHGFRIMLTIVAVTCGLLLFARAILGPFHFVVPVSRSLNLQSAFGLSATLALLCGSMLCGVPSSRPDPPTLQIRRDWLSIALLISGALFAFWQNLFSFFLSDDFYLLRIASAASPYPTDLLIHGGGSEFFRPVGGLLLLLTSWVAGVDPFYWHLSSVLFHAANAVLVFLLARQLFPDCAGAFVAAVLFAIHGTTPEAVAWVAGRFDLIATFFVLCSLISFITYHRTRIRVAYYASLVSMILGMLSKESAYVFPLLLTAVLAVTPGVSRRDFLQTRIFWAGAIVMFAIRWYILGGIGGYVDKASGRPLALSINPMQIVKVIAMRNWSAFYFPINWSVEPSVLVASLLLLSVIVVVYIIAQVNIERRYVFFTLAFTVIASLPVLHQLLIASDLQKSRLLYLPLVGFCLLMGISVSGLRSRRFQFAVAAILLLFHFVCLRHNLAIWRDVAILADKACGQIVKELPSSATGVSIPDLPGSLNGVYFLRNGLGGCLDLKAGRRLNLRIETKNPESVSDPGTTVFPWDKLRSSRD